MKSPVASYPSIALINVRSAYNVGVILRSADAVKVHTVYCVGYTPLPINPKVSKTALGAQVNWEHHCHPLSLIRQNQPNLTFISLETGQASTNLFTSPLPPNTCFLVGNEVDGLPQKVLNLCSSVCHLPQHGIKESLNVSVAGSVALYEYRRRYPLKTNNH